MSPSKTGKGGVAPAAVRIVLRRPLRLNGELRPAGFAIMSGLPEGELPLRVINKALVGAPVEAVLDKQ